ncbi:MAG: argininosuccinate lyase [Balneolaceae bacterium]
MSKIWQKSTTDSKSDTAKKVEAFTVGNDYQLDQVLVPFDVKASKVHAKALHKAKIITDSELTKLVDALSDVQRLWKKDEFEITVEDEDMHTAIENYLIDNLGDLGKKIHTGRSRNDQVLTAMRLYEKESLIEVLDEVRNCAKLLIDFGEKYENVPMPGFTHTRKAMLSSVGLWAGGFAEMLIIQLDAASGIQSQINRSPLGTAAGFGTTFDIDREMEAEELGFSNPIICSTTAQLSRGWIELHLVQYLAGVTSVLNRLASDIIQFSSEAYPWFELDDVVCTGSSIMPQKKNPDVAELIRGSHAEMIGYAATLQSLTVNLGSGYHRDLQLTKEPVLKAVSKTMAVLQAAQLLINHMTPMEANLSKACTPELFAAEAANLLVKKNGLSFREAYKKVAEEPDLARKLTPQKLMEEFTHLGSPGNSGISKLKSLLES